MPRTEEANQRLREEQRKKISDGYAVFRTIAATQGQSVNQAQLATYAHDPYTAIILFILITYYIVYYAFLIRKEKQLELQTGEGQ